MRPSELDLVLLIRAISHLEPDAYGVTIMEYLEGQGCEWNLGKIYVYLDELEDRLLIKSDYVERGTTVGRKKRVVSLTEGGKFVAQFFPY